MINIFTPERVPGENRDEYRQRRHNAAQPMPATVITQTPAVKARRRPFQTDGMRQAVKQLKKDIGARQAKKLLREERRNK